MTDKYVELHAASAFSFLKVAPSVYERYRTIVTRSKFIRAEGLLQNQEDVIHVKAVRLITLSEEGLEVRSHDFH